MRKRSVAVIGAGPSGLVSGKVLLKDGFDVTIFEKQKELGGIWCKDWAYADLRTQQVKGFMEYSDFPDSEGKDFASWEDIHLYLNKYAEHFDLIKRIKFERKIISINKKDLKDENLQWIIEIERNDGINETYEFDSIVIASGLFSTPFIPFIPGEEKFSGSILHGSQIKRKEELENKDVIIIGGGKCASDMATLAGQYGKSCHMIFRRAHCLLPYRIFGGYLSFKYVYTRFLTSLYDPFPDAPSNYFLLFFQKNFKFIFNKFYKMMEQNVIQTYDKDLFDDEIYLPKGSYRHPENALRISNEFIQLKKEKKIIGKLTSIKQIIDQTTIQLQSGELLKTDFIICATGFIQQFTFLSQEFNQLLGLNQNQLNLYRRIIPIGIPNIAFIGFISSSNQWIITEITSHWISEYFLQRIKLPIHQHDMKQEIQKFNSFIQKQFNQTSSFIQYYWLQPILIYLKDMNLPLHTKNNWIEEYFTIYTPNRFQFIHQQRNANAQRNIFKILYYRLYFSFTQTIVILFFFLYFFFFC